MAILDVSREVGIIANEGDNGLVLRSGSRVCYIAIEEIEPLIARLREAAHILGVEFPGDAELAAAQASAAELRDALERTGDA